MKLFSKFKDILIILLLIFNIWFIVKWLDIEANIDNAVQYIKQVVFTTDGTKNWTINVNINWINWNIDTNWNLTTKQVIDVNNSTYRVDMNWDSRINSLVVDQKIWLNNATPAYTFDMVWNARINNNTAQEPFIVYQNSSREVLKINSNWAIELNDTASSSAWDIYSNWWADSIFWIFNKTNWWTINFQIWDSLAAQLYYNKNFRVYWNLTSQNMKATCVWNCF